ncbi:MAG TPA: methylmalonyl-CoA epimerase [Candidatus Saccharimonadales bacterium]|nr:methylmalonyl-CoA epimerase [Candidatus Saccharimonadales bacterium]
MAIQLSHIGVAVRDMEDAVQRWLALGARKTGEEVLESMQLHLVFLDLGGTAVELIASRAPDTPVARFLERRGPGLHHLSIQVPDLESALREAEARGLRLIDRTPRDGAHHMQVAFLHPDSAAGVLVEYCQPRPERSAGS